jgi:hypothetical protein
MKSPLTWDERQNIAKVVSWDCFRAVQPSEIESIYVDHDIAMICMSNDRLHPIAVKTFKQIQDQQKLEAATK